MEAEQNSRMEMLERQNKRLEKQNEEIKEQMNRIMEMIAGIAKGRAQEEGQTSGPRTPSYPPGFEPDSVTQAPIGDTIAPPQTTEFAQFPLPPVRSGEFPFIPQAQPTAASGGFPFTMHYRPAPVYNVPPPTTGENIAKPVVIPEDGNIEGAEKSASHVDEVNQALFGQFEERLRAMEGATAYGTLDAGELSLVEGLVVPPKFKVPEFDKYNGTTSPRNHLTMYRRKMAAYSHDDKMLIHFFQDSLTGSAIS